MLEGVKRRASMCQAFYPFFHLRERYIVSVSSNFPVPKGHDANFAWNQYETAVKFVREYHFVTYPCFYGSKCSFAKIAIPYTIYISLNLPEFYV